jgi:hypothetical protein
MVLAVRRACGHIGLAACRAALEATGGDVDAAIRRVTRTPPPGPAFDRATATEAYLRHVRARRDDLAARVRLAAPDQRGVRLADDVREGWCPTADVYLEVRPFEALAGATAVRPEDVADALVDALGLSMQGTGWITIDLPAARRAFAWLVGHSLVWGTSDMSEEDAAELRDRCSPARRRASPPTYGRERTARPRSTR